MTTWTQFCLFWPPPTSTWTCLTLNWHFFDHLPPLHVHVVIECPQTPTLHCITVHIGWGRILTIILSWKTGKVRSKNINKSEIDGQADIAGVQSCQVDQCCQSRIKLATKLLSTGGPRLVRFHLVQWIFDLRKFLRTAKNFLKSKIFLKSNTQSSLRYANWKYYIYFYGPIYYKEHFQMLFIVK